MSRWPARLSTRDRPAPVVCFDDRGARAPVVNHEPMARPAGAPMSFVCPRCRIALSDDVDYTWCPVCDALVDWDATPERMRRRPSAHPPVPSPAQAGSAPAPRRSYLAGIIGGIAAAALIVLHVIELLAYALDPLGFAFVAPVLLVIVGIAIALIIALFAAIGEIWALARDRRTRVLHGLEHACIKLLERDGRTPLSGQTHDGFFEVELRNDGRASTDAVERAVSEAIARIAAGESSLALDRRCGTSLMVGLLAVSLLIIGGIVGGLVEGVPRNALIAATAGAALLAWLAGAPLGLLAQRTLTVSTRFAAAAARRVGRRVHSSGDRVTFLVHVDVFLTPPPALAADRFALAHPGGFPAPPALPRSAPRLACACALEPEPDLSLDTGGRWWLVQVADPRAASDPTRPTPTVRSFAESR